MTGITLFSEKVVRIALKLTALALGVLVVGFGSIYFLSEMNLRDFQHGPAFDYPIPTDAASIERGRHIARTRGCFGCHGQQLEGKDFGDQWDWPERAVAPNLSAYVKANDPSVTEAAIRQGIGRKGKALTSMPSYNFTRLTDSDLAALIAFLNSAPLVEVTLPKPKLGWAVRWDFARGTETHMAKWVEGVPELRVDPVANPRQARGEYLAMTMCNECHGLDVRGQTLFGPPTPDLAIVSAYSREGFETLLKTGVAPGGRKLGLMSLVAPDRFPDLTDDELDDLYEFLTSLPDAPIPENVFWRPAR